MPKFFAVLLLATSTLAAVPAVAEDVPDGVQMLLKRGDIPAIFSPQFVNAKDAGILDDAWILGVEVNGEARAYSISLLNHHEIVNDTVGGHPLAAVW